jgi:GT2 family glycosyltransferase
MSNSKTILPVSALVPTRNRTACLSRMLHSLAGQSAQPVEMILVDASASDETEELCKASVPELRTRIVYLKAVEVGAAAQRNLGVGAATQPVIWFFDDDILFKDDCADHLWRALQSDPRLGGVNAMIVNQCYQPPGRVSSAIFQLLRGHAEATYAGLVIGPAVNLLPEDRDDMPEVVPVEWLNTTCTMYRREALPTPPFDSVFTGYSLMEDLALSLRVRREWRLANARTARIFHDSQQGTHKADVRALATMELVNRHYVMTRVLNQRRPSAYLKLLLWEIFQLASCAAGRSTRSKLPQALKGKMRGLRQIWRTAQ